MVKRRAATEPGQIQPAIRKSMRRVTPARMTCPRILARFQNGPWGILWRCWSPRVSASAPHEQIQPQ